MEMFFVTFIVMALFFVCLGLGYLFTKKELKGSCGGLNRVMGEDCDFCEKKDQCSDLEKENCDGAHFKPIEIKDGNAVLVD